MSVGLCKVNPHLLAEALHMPEGTVIDNAQWDMREGQIVLRVQHPDIPAVPEGCPLKYSNVLVITYHDAQTPDRVARSYKGEWR